MDDWVEAHAPPREGMRSRPELNVGGSSNKARRQTTRTAEEQRDYERAYTTEYTRRKRALEAEAKVRLHVIVAHHFEYGGAHTQLSVPQIA